MEHDWFRFSVAFWHTFCGTGGDPFGYATKYWLVKATRRSWTLIWKQSLIILQNSLKLLLLTRRRSDSKVNSLLFFFFCQDCNIILLSSGTLLIEPKPQKPTKHQYDWDDATSTNFLRKYGRINEFKLNIECNHATLSGHTCHHELETARINGLLGDIDATPAMLKLVMI